MLGGPRTTKRGQKSVGLGLGLGFADYSKFLRNGRTAGHMHTPYKELTDKTIQSSPCLWTMKMARGRLMALFP